MPKEKLKFILSHLLRSQVKLDDAPASAQSHFDLAIVELDKLIEDYQDSDPECNQVLTDAKEHITMYHQGKTGTYEKPFEVIIPEFTKIRFRYNGSEKIGYIYDSLGDKLFVSENRTLESIGLAQNWVINKRDVLEQLI